MTTLEPHKDDKQVLAESRARSEYGLDTLANVPVARYNSYMGNSYAVYRRGDLRVAQANKRAADAAAAAIATEARERELEVEYGGPEGLKRKREEDAVVAKKKREDDVATAKKAASTATMTALMVDLFSKNVPCDGRGLPAHDSNMSKKQAKTTFKLTDTDLTKLTDKGPIGQSKSSYAVADLMRASKMKHWGITVPPTVQQLDLEVLKAANPDLVVDAFAEAGKTLRKRADDVKIKSDAALAVAESAGRVADTAEKAAATAAVSANAAKNGEGGRNVVYCCAASSGTTSTASTAAETTAA